jgi:hypothetical protein
MNKTIIVSPLEIADLVELLNDLELKLYPIIEKEFDIPWYKEFFNFLIGNWYSPTLRLWNSVVVMKKSLYNHYITKSYKQHEQDTKVI